MKILILITTLLFSTLLYAGPHHRHFHHRHYQPFYNPPIVHWVAPALIGGVVTYALTRPTPYTEVIVEQPVPQCSEWREVQQQDGTIVRERFCSQR